MIEGPLQTLVWSRTVSQPAMTGRPMRRRTIGPASSVWPAGMSLSHHALATSVAGRAHARWHGCKLYGVFSHTLVRLASGLSEQCVKKQSGLAGSCFGGHMALDLRLSQVRTGVSAMGQDCNYQLDTMKLGRQKGVKILIKIKPCTKHPSSKWLFCVLYFEKVMYSIS